jgi:hypothetical protein
MISEKKLLKLAVTLARVADAEPVPICALLRDACQSYVEAVNCMNGDCGQIRTDEEYCEDCACERGEREDAEANAEAEVE